METLSRLNNDLDKTKSIYDGIQKQISIVLVATVAVALILNLTLLTYLGPKGEELSSIRRMQEEQKLKNDLMRAELENTKVNSQIEEKAKKDLNMREADVTIVKTNENNIAHND